MSIIQRNSERSNTANYCSCWQIQPQNRSASCQPHALTTVTTKGNSKVYHCFIFTVEPVAVSLSLNHPENREGNSAKHTVSVGVLIISEEQETIVLLLPWIKTGLQMLLVIFNGTKKCKGHEFKPLKAWWPEAQACPCHNWEVQSWGDFILTHTPTQHQSLG